MSRINFRVMALGGALVAGLGLAACGDDFIATTCGEGTRLDGKTCVPDGPDTECGAGTVLMGNECVPDGSVICEQGTVFDTDSGQCVVDPSACAAGTVFVGGTCVPEDDTLTADLDEAAEPNDAAGAGQFAAPALGEDITLHGCITPREGVRDEDVWILTTTEPTALEITADGVGGLAAAFLLQDNGIPSLPQYFRAGINLSGDTSRRQVFLPVAGTYVLVMDDSRAILVDEVAGGPETCYYTTVERIALPAPEGALAVPTQTGNDTGDLRVLTYTADANGDILRTVMTTTSASLSPAFIIMRGDGLIASTGPVAATATTAAISPQWTEGGLNAGNTLTFVIDHQYNFSPNPTPYTLTSLDLAAQALPTDGSTVTVTGRRNGTDGATDLTKLSYLYFDVTGQGAIVRWNWTASQPLDMFIVRKNVLTNNSFQVFAIIDAPGGAMPAGRTTFNNEHTRFLQPGRYYMIVQNPLGTAMAGEMYTITSTLTPVTPTPVVYGTPLTGQTLPASGVGFHTIDFTNPTWVEFAATATDWGAGNVRISAFDPAGEGWMGANYAPVFQGDQAPSGAAPFGRIMVGETRDFILRVLPTMAPGAAASYELAVRDRPHTAINIMPGTTTRNDEALRGLSNAANAQNVTRYLITGQPFSRLVATVNPDAASDVIIRRRNVDESTATSVDAGLVGAAETLTVTIPNTPANFVAFTVGDFSAVDSTFDLSLVHTAAPYGVTTSNLSFIDACPIGTVVATGLDDTLTSAIALPAGFASFPFFGTATGGSIKVSSNGWLTFDTALTSSLGGNTAYPNAAAPNALVSPYAEDLVNVTICTRTAGDTFIVQWTGSLYNVAAETAQFQAALHENGAIDFIYGPNHTLNGSEIETQGTAGATIGVENATGTAAIQLGFNQNVIAPGSSRTFTPPAP